MKWLKYYDDQNLKSGDDVFNYFMDTLKPSVTDWDYFLKRKVNNISHRISKKLFQD